MRPLFSLSIALLVAAPAAAPANPLIAAARESGLLDTETALLYELYEALEPASLPSEYRDENPGPRGCATPLILDALEARDGGSPGYGRALAKALARPRLSHQVLSPSGRFRIHYDIEGEHAVDPADADNNGIPDYVDVTAAVIDSVWRLEIEVLGYDPPPTDGTLGGGDEYDIYIEQILGGYYGFTQPEGNGPRGHSYLRIDNNFTESIFGRASSCQGARGARELTALRVTLAHEFFHMIQFGYFQGREGIWWQESSATWMEEVAYPEADDYLQYLCDFIRSPERSLESPTFRAGASTARRSSPTFSTSATAARWCGRSGRSTAAGKAPPWGTSTAPSSASETANPARPTSGTSVSARPSTSSRPGTTSPGSGIGRGSTRRATSTRP